MKVSEQEALAEAKKLDAVDDKANDKKFTDRKDKDIDNDGDVDSSDEYLHKKRAATDDAIDGGKKPAKTVKESDDEEEGEEDDKKKKSKKPNPFAKKDDDEETEIDEARQMKDPKKDTMVTKGGKTIVIDKSKEAEYLKKGCGQRLLKQRLLRKMVRSTMTILLNMIRKSLLCTRSLIRRSKMEKKKVMTLLLKQAERL